MAVRPGIFPTFFLSGFECSTFIWKDGIRKDYVQITGHDRYLREVPDPDSDHQVHRAFWASHGVEGMVEHIYVERHRESAFAGFDADGEVVYRERKGRTIADPESTGCVSSSGSGSGSPDETGSG